jgi:hypothetical protein
MTDTPDTSQEAKPVAKRPWTIAHNLRQKAKREARRNKVCAWCSVPYVDHTKRIVGKTCSSECAYALGVATRKAAGTYTRTDIQNEKLSKTLKAQYEDGSRTVTINEAHEWWRNATQEQINARTDRRRQTVTRKCGKPHWSQTPEGRKRISAIHSGKKVPPERMQALRQAAMKSHNMHSRSKKGIRQDLGCFFRSTWEANLARYFNHIGLKWRYEPVTYQLPENRTYTPDFVLESGVIVEVKGWLTKTGKEKLEGFNEYHPAAASKLVLVDKPVYETLRKLYQFDLPNWER